MKKYRTITPIILAVLMLLSSFQFFYGFFAEKRQIKATLKLAESYKEQKLYGIAEDAYSDLIALSNEPKYYEAVIKMYNETEDYDKVKDWAQKMKQNFPKEVKAYELLLGAYIAKEDYSDVFALFKEIKSREIASKTITDIWEKIKFVYKIEGITVSEAGIYSGDYSWAYNGEKYCILKPNGRRMTDYLYKQIGYFANDVCPVELDEDWFFIGTDLEFKANLSYNFDFDIKEVGVYNSDMYPISDGEKYFYSNLKYETGLGPYDYAGGFSNGVAAVIKDGDWYLINTEGKKVSGPYENIVLDERGVCCSAERVFVKEDGKYYLIDTEGEKISKTAYDDARLFLSADEYAAVKINGSWSFVDVSGKNIDMPESYDDATSFRCGLAAVCRDGLYGYVDMSGNWIIEPQFTEAHSFNIKGCALAEDRNSWKRILLYQYNS